MLGRSPIWINGSYFKLHILSQYLIFRIKYFWRKKISLLLYYFFVAQYYVFPFLTKLLPISANNNIYNIVNKTTSETFNTSQYLGVAKQLSYVLIQHNIIPSYFQWEKTPSISLRREQTTSTRYSLSETTNELGIKNNVSTGLRNLYLL